MSLTATAPALDYDVLQPPPYLGMTDDRFLTTGPDSKVLAQIILDIRQFQPALSFQPFAQYRDIERKLEGLLRTDESDDFGPLRPSRPAFEATRQLLLDLAVGGFVIPTPEDVDTDHDGQIRIAWRTGGRFLELVAPYESEASRYVYHSDDTTFNIEPVGSSEVLKNWLNWMR
jgi:hypothetical protein